MARRLIVFSVVLLSIFVTTRPIIAQDPPSTGCPEVPREDALPSLCAPPTSAAEAQSTPPIVLPLVVPSGTPLRIAVDKKIRIAKPGEAIHGKLVEPIYAFDQMVIPAGATAIGHVTQIDPVPVKLRTISYANGNFSPTRHYQITFDKLILPDGRQLPIQTSVAPGIAQVVHLTAGSGKEKEEPKKKNAAARAVENAKEEASTKVHETMDEVNSPGKMESFASRSNALRHPMA